MEEVLQTEVSALQLVVLVVIFHFYLNGLGSFNRVLSYKEILQAMMKHEIQVYRWIALCCRDGEYCLALPDCSWKFVWVANNFVSGEEKYTWGLILPGTRATCHNLVKSVARCPFWCARTPGVELMGWIIMRPTVTEIISPILFMINNMKYRFECINSFRGQCFTRLVYEGKLINQHFHPQMAQIKLLLKINTQYLALKLCHQQKNVLAFGSSSL